MTTNDLNAYIASHAEPHGGGAISLMLVLGLVGWIALAIYVMGWVF